MENENELARGSSGSIELVVTDKRVTKTNRSTGEVMDIPVDKIETVAKLKKSGLQITTASGKIVMKAMSNLNGVYEEIVQLLIDRQGESIPKVDPNDKKSKAKNGKNAKVAPANDEDEIKAAVKDLADGEIKKTLREILDALANLSVVAAPGATVASSQISEDITADVEEEDEAETVIDDSEDEAIKLAEEEAKKAEEELRKAEEELKKIEEEEAARVAAEEAEAAKKAEEEAKKAEAAKKAEEAKKAEAAKKAEEVDPPTGLRPRSPMQAARGGSAGGLGGGLRGGSSSGGGLGGGGLRGGSSSGGLSGGLGGSSSGGLGGGSLNGSSSGGLGGGGLRGGLNSSSGESSTGLRSRSAFAGSSDDSKLRDSDAPEKKGSSTVSYTSSGMAVFDLPSSRAKKEEEPAKVEEPVVEKKAEESADEAPVSPFAKAVIKPNTSPFAKVVAEDTPAPAEPTKNDDGKMVPIWARK